MNYRQMLLRDHPGVIELWRACEGLGLRDSDSEEGLRRYLERNPGLSFVAEQSERIVATIMAGHDARRGYLQHLAVHPNWRCQGIAGHLIELCLDGLKSQGIEKSHVHVIGANRAGRDFWIRRGWHHRPEIELYSFVNGDNPNV